MRTLHTRDELRAFEAANAAVRLINREGWSGEKLEAQAKPSAMETRADSPGTTDPGRPPRAKLPRTKLPPVKPPPVKPAHCTGVFTRLAWRTLCFSAGGDDERRLCGPCLMQRGAEDALRAQPPARENGPRGRRDSFPPTTFPPVRCWCSPGRGYRCESCTEQDNHLRYGSSTPPAGS